MSDYANKLSTIAEKKQKLLQEEAKLIENRKKEIGNFAEQFGLLTLSDQHIVGVFAEVQSAIKTKSDKIKQWESQGAQHLKPKRNGKTTQESSK